VAICIAFFILFLSLGQGIHNLIDSEANNAIDEENIKKYRDMDAVITEWLFILIVIISIIMIVAITNTMLMSTVSRIKEFGTLKAVGINKSQILKIVVIEALILTGFAYLIGTIIGIWVALIFDYMYNVGGGLGVFFAPTQITASSILAAAMLAVGIGTLASIYPAVKAANLDPVEALKYE
jgi:putative ABC transport system permease protein